VPIFPFLREFSVKKKRTKKARMARLLQKKKGLILVNHRFWAQALSLGFLRSIDRRLVLCHQHQSQQQ